MARRTKAEIRAAKIAELARKRRELDDLLRAEQREAAKEAKAAFVASQAALGKAVAESVGAASAEAVDAALEALVADGALDRVREVLAAQEAPEEPGGDADADAEGELEAAEEEAEPEPTEDVSEVDQPEPDGGGESGQDDVPEAVGEPADPSDHEPTPGYQPWGA